jgi:hypothetical protein
MHLYLAWAHYGFGRKVRQGEIQDHFSYYDVSLLGFLNGIRPLGVETY